NICWQLFVSPTTKVNHYTHEDDSFIEVIFHVIILYYMYFTFAIYWCIHGFVLGYKFLFHMKSRSLYENYRLEGKKLKSAEKEQIENKNKLRKFFRFILQQFYLYFFFIFMFFIACNLDKVFIVLNNPN